MYYSVMDNLQEQARVAITKLNQFKTDYRQGKISYDLLKTVATPHINTFNLYSQRLAKLRGVTAKKISLTGFIR